MSEATTPKVVDYNPQGTYTESLSYEIKQYYSKYLLERSKANLVHQQFGEKAPLPKHGGKSVEWRRFSAFPKATTPLQEGVTPDGTPIEVGHVTAQLEQFGAYSTITDIIDMTAIDNIVLEATDLHADNMALTLDTIVRNALIAGIANVIYPSDSITSINTITGANKITPNLINMAVTTLKKKNAKKIGDSYVCIIHPSVSYDLTTDPNWIDVQKYQNATTIYNGEIGKLYGVRFVETTEAYMIKNSAGKAVYGCIFIADKAYKVIDIEGAGAEVIVKPRGSSGTADPLNQRSTVGWVVPQFAAKVTNEDNICCLYVGSTFSDTDAKGLTTTN